MKKNKYKNIYEKFSFSNKYKKELVDFFRNNTTVETGGNRLFDGNYNHLLQIPEELADLIFELKKKNYKLKSLLEIGFSHGYTNTILNKFFKFKFICGVDKFGAHINGQSLLPNLRFKNLFLICGDTKSQFTKNILKKFDKFDLIFIDADHSYDAVKNDFELSLNLSHKNTTIVFHDIFFENSGSKKLWNELKISKKYMLKEIICKDHNFNFGTGVLRF